MAFLKPQNPMTKGSDYFYPLTTADQVIMDGGYRLDEIVGKTKKSTIMLYANGWSAEVPYCYSVVVQGLSDKVNMKMLPHFPEDFEGKQAMKEETAKISFATREGNILTFECWDEVPTMDLPIDIEIEAMYPIKGASIEMNYSVVGGVEEPAEPTENMIWVNTNQNITDWVFSKNEPKNPEEGMIWFTIGDNSNVSFFALRMDKREFDEVYPLSAKQYVNGKWESKTVYIYQSGEWCEWFLYVISQIGSFKTVRESGSGTITINGTNVVATTNGNTGAVAYYSDVLFDLSKYKTLKFHLNRNGFGELAIGFTKSNTDGSPYDEFVASFWGDYTVTSLVREVTIDVSNVSQKAYFCVFMTAINDDISNTQTTTLTNLRLEA